MKTVAALSLVATLLVGCSVESTEEPVGAASVAITSVPADVACVRLVATGTTRAVTRDFDVTAGASSVLSLTSIPTGSVTFRGTAFSTACSAVTTSSVPSWLADDVVAPVSSSTVAEVKLTMRRNGRASVSVDFADDSCPTGFEDCDGDTSNGCETDLSSPDHCGTCGTVCPAAPNVVRKCTAPGGMYSCGFVCIAGFADCDGNPSNGCETSLTTTSNCGSCGKTCPIACVRDSSGAYVCL